MNILDTLKKAIQKEPKITQVAILADNHPHRMDLSFLEKADSMNEAILKIYSQVREKIDSILFSNTSLTQNIFLFPDFPVKSISDEHTENQKLLHNYMKEKEINSIYFPHLIYCIHNHPDDINHSTDILQTVASLIDQYAQQYDKYTKSFYLDEHVRIHKTNELSTQERTNYILNQYSMISDYKEFNSFIKTYRPYILENEELKNRLVEKTYPYNNLAFFLVTYDMEVNQETAKQAMMFYANERFKYTHYSLVDPERYFYQNDWLPNPLNHFYHDILSVKDWHEIATLNAHIIPMIPREIRQNTQFWNPFSDFIPTLSKLKNSSISADMNFNILDYLPTKLQKDQDLIIQLHKSRILTLIEIPKLTEKIYKATNPEEYQDIPYKLKIKEDFYTNALEAVNFHPSNLRYVPDEVKDKQIIQTAMKIDFRLMKDYPEHVEQSIIDGYFLPDSHLQDKVIRFSYGNGIFQERDNFLYYLPDEFKTKENCLNALSFGIKNFAYIPDRLKQEIAEEIELPEFYHKKTGTLSFSTDVIIDLLSGREITIVTDQKDQTQKEVLKFKLLNLNRFFISEITEEKIENKQKSGLKL